MAELSEDERTTPIGLFNYATTYWQSAKHLQNSKLKSTHPIAPVSFLYFHAIELYLKSFLRLHGVTTAQLRSKYGHGYNKLARKARQLGLSYDDEDVEVLSLMDDTNAVIRSRYISTGLLEGPSIEALERTCRSLSQTIAEGFKELGQYVRL